MPAQLLNFPQPAQGQGKAGAIAERVRELLHYEPFTGIFTWKKAYCTKVVVGRVAGHRNKTTRYVEIRIEGVLYTAHRLAWLYVHGAWPECVIDHIDKDRGNNRLANLRQATHSQNHANCQVYANNALGVRNVIRCGDGYRVTLKKNYKPIYIGTFPTLAEADTAAKNARAAHFGEFGAS